MKKIGFCKQCLQNVPHILYFQWPGFRLLNRSPEFANSLPLASWHCCGCEKNSFRLKRPDPEVRTDVTSTDMADVIPWPDRNDPTQRFGLLFRRKRKTNILEKSKMEATADVETGGAEHVGNVTRSDDSLLVRKARASRYSKKFREDIVQRILTGHSTISQVRRELGLSERDLLDWINDRVMRQDQHIAKLGQIVETVRKISTDGASTLNADNARHLNIHSDDLNLEPSSKSKVPAPKGATIDGRVNRG